MGYTICMVSHSRRKQTGKEEEKLNLESSSKGLSSKAKALAKRINDIRPYYRVIGLFILYLLLLPQLTFLLVPCLASPGGQFEFTECNIVIAIDAYMKMALVGYVVATFVLFYFFKNNTKRVVLFCLAGFMALLVVGGYYINIPLAERSVRSVSIYLDSLYDGSPVDLNI